LFGGVLIAWIGLPYGVLIALIGASIILLVREREVASLILVGASVVLWRATAEWLRIRSRCCETIALSLGITYGWKPGRHKVYGIICCERKG
jgi:hypothetical protein